MTHRFPVRLALACAALPFAALLSPARAAAAVAATGVPWGDWLAGLLQPVSACLVPSPPRP